MLNLQSALRLASQDKEFADALIRNPEQFQKGFNLTDKQVAGLKKASELGFKPGVLAASGDYNLS